jgi:hypothetical protein
MKVIISKGPSFKETERKIYQYLNEILTKKGANENVKHDQTAG